jgi:hypothetical protein
MEQEPKAKIVIEQADRFDWLSEYRGEADFAEIPVPYAVAKHVQTGDFIMPHEDFPIDFKVKFRAFLKTNEGWLLSLSCTVGLTKKERKEIEDKI